MASPSSPPTTDAAHSTPVVIAPPSADGIVEVDNNEGDSAYGDNNSTSDWTSVTSSIYKGVFENGRRYQSTKEGEYFLPADEQQAEAMANTHLAFLLHDQFEENQLFRSPLGKGATDILDIGTGSGEWAVDVADKFPGSQSDLTLDNNLTDY